MKNNPFSKSKMRLNIQEKQRVYERDAHNFKECDTPQVNNITALTGLLWFSIMKGPIT